MERRVLRPSKRKWTLLLLLFVAFTATGIAMFLIDGDWIGLLCAAFFGLGIPISILTMWRTRLVLAPDGFTMDSGFKSKTYRWSDVEEFFPASISATTQVAWRFAPHYDELSTIRRINESVAGVEASLGDNFGMKVEELADLMNEWRARYAPERRPEPEPAMEAASNDDVFGSAPGERRSNQ